MSDLRNRLSELKDLLDEGLIDADDYARQKEAILAGGVASPPPYVPPPPSALQGETVVNALPEKLGSYKVLEPIGAGGMGTVVRARHVEEGWAKRQGGDVAIKLIHGKLAGDPKFRERFFSEAQLGMTVVHPSVARTYEVVSEGDALGLVMEFVPGGLLANHIVAGGLPLSDVVDLLKPLAAALDDLHAKEIVHRDLKPANIKIRPDGSPVILDFGIAKDLKQDQGLTATATALGTAGWMAPEQVDAKHVGPAADRYALGLISYALLSGRMPWPDGATAGRVASLKLSGGLVPLGESAPNVPPHAAEAVAKMTALEPSDRPSTSAEFVAALASPRTHTADVDLVPKPTPKPVMPEPSHELKKAAPPPAPERPSPVADPSKVDVEAEDRGDFWTGFVVTFMVSLTICVPLPWIYFAAFGKNQQQKQGAHYGLLGWGIIVFLGVLLGMMMIALDA